MNTYKGDHMSTLHDLLGIAPETEAFCQECEKELQPIYAKIDETMHLNGAKVLHAISYSEKSSYRNLLQSDSTDIVQLQVLRE